MDGLAPVDVVVIILAASIGLGLIVTTIAPMVLRQPLTEERSKLLSALVVAIIAIISAYVASQT